MSQILTIPDDVIDRSSPAVTPLDETEAARRYGRLLQASAGAVRALGGLEERFAGETDWATAPERFRVEAEAIGRGFANSFGGDRTSRALFLRDFTSLADARAAAFAVASESRERAALQDAYAERMDGLGRMARFSDGDQRNEILRQTALEAHRAHAFGLEADPVMAMDRITAGIAPKMPMDGSFGTPNTPAVDRDAFERQAREGWRHEAVPKAVAKAQERPVLGADRAGQAFGFSDSPLNEGDRRRYKDIQNVGEPREARTLDVIGREYSAAKKALDVDPNDTAAQQQLANLDRELDLYPFKMMLGDVAFGKGFEKATGLDRVILFAGKRAKSVMELYELYENLREFDKDRKETDAIRGR